MLTMSVDSFSLNTSFLFQESDPEECMSALSVASKQLCEVPSINRDPANGTSMDSEEHIGYVT